MRFRPPLDAELDHRLGSERLARTAPSRRGFVAGAALAGFSLTAPVAAHFRIALPQQTMRLRRVLERALYDGSIIGVEREWAVEFRRQRAGIVITGHHVSARVSAPQALEAMARIERRRSTQRLFPITLDAVGRIMDAGPFTLHSDIALAAQAASRLWPSNDAARPNPFELLRQIPQGPNLSQTGMGDHLPPDLFFPFDRDQRTLRKLDFPDGLSGEIELWNRAKSQADQPWLEHWERTVTTSFGGSRRKSSEIWSLSSL